MFTNLLKSSKPQSRKKSDHEIFLEELFQGSNKEEKDNRYKSIFKYDSINQYKSIHQFDKLHRQNGYIENESKEQAGLEVFLNYGIIGFFYFFMVILMPFSLIFCLKKVKQNERLVVYRLGRIIQPEFKPGYHICFPFIDSYKRLATSQKEFSVPNLQILTYENCIVDTTTIVRYEVFDAIKLLNSLENLNDTLKSIARGYLVGIISKKDSNKVEVDKTYILQEFMGEMNDYIRKWGVKITNVDLKINSIEVDQQNDGEDPALKTISQVFKSLLNGNTTPSTTSDSAPSGDKPLNSLPNELIKFIEGLSKPMVIPNDGSVGFPFMPNMNPQETVVNMEATGDAAGSQKMTPYTILKLLEPLLNESMVKEIQTVYEFHIQSTTDANLIEIFHLDLKSMSKGIIGKGYPPFSKTDCVIKLNDEDLNELLADNLKPFTAYMSGRIEIEGDLQDVFKLKKLITSVSTVINSLK